MASRAVWPWPSLGCQCTPIGSGKGWIFGHTFLLLVHRGRATGSPHSTVAMVLDYNPDTQEAVICSAWGGYTDWIRNIQTHPAIQIQIGRESFKPQHRFLSQEESLAVVSGCLRRHPWRFRFVARVLGWADLHIDSRAREFVRTRPLVSFRPATPVTK